jgi:hypothetical protein
MKKFFYFIFFFILIILIGAVAYLSLYGYETSRFNLLIEEKISKQEPNSKVQFESIKIKLDLKKLNLFIFTNNPEVFYYDVKIPILETKAYFKIISLLEGKPKLHRIILDINKLKTKDLQKIAVRIKPSNFKRYLLNNVNEGEVERGKIDISFDDNFKIEDFKVNGKINGLNAKFSKNITVDNISLNFIFDKNLVLLNSINTNFKNILIKNGNIKIEKKENIVVSGKFNSKFDLKENGISDIFSFSKSDFFKKNIIKAEGATLHEFNLKLSDTLQILNYSYTANGKIKNAKILFKNNLKLDFFNNSINQLNIEQSIIKVILNKNEENSLVIEGRYKTNNSNYKKFKIKNNLKKKNSDYSINLELSENISISLLNFKNDNKKKSVIQSEFKFINNELRIKSFKFIEGKNFINVNNLNLDKNYRVSKFKNIKIKTFKKNIINNDFEIIFGKKILIKGEKYDATLLLKQISSNNNSQILKKISKNIEINLKTLVTKSLIPLNDFRLIGEIKKGKFVKISSKSKLTENKFLDISLKEDRNKKKILEIYSGLPKILLADYKFFEGIKDGKLLYTSVIDDSGSVSKLTIEDFRVLKAPAFATLLTLADLGGIADLLSGKGMTFDILEINLNEDKNTTTIEEILALGPSVSIQLNGYIEKKTGLVSLSGTMVPAKMLNSLISKIPVVGNILVGEKAGEGVFGVSFKMKGLPGKIKTTVNPVKTLTPRFITRAIEKQKKKNSK